MTDISEFEEIRPYLDEEIPAIIEKLVADPIFAKVIPFAFPNMTMEDFAQKTKACHTKLEFQKAFCYPFLKNIIRDHTEGVQIDVSSITDSNPHTYVSNHRDIVLDSGFLDIMLIDKNIDTVEIAIGDNLLIYPWIKWFARINKSFIVQRELTMRKMLESSARMSRYMHYCITEKKQSIWIAQREGRAKDSDDQTQESVLKMFTMGGEGDFIDRLLSLNITPLAISYEYDPCDYLKAKEFQLKRDIEDYKKTPQDDLENMMRGFVGYKGRVMYRPAPSINKELTAMDHSLPKSKIIAKAKEMINHGIHTGYEFYPTNYVAYDLLNSETRFATKYTIEEKENFNNYIDKQLTKIKIRNKDNDFLRNRLLVMYANPLKNFILATQ